MKYMKKMICMLIAVLLICCAALAESTPSESPAVQIQVVTPTPTALPLGAVFSGEGLTVTLPYGMDILDEAARAGFDAAVQADFPDVSRTILAAAKPDFSAAAYFALSESELDAAAAAREAAQKILNSTITVSDITLGENNYSGFACAIGDQIYKIYYLANEGSMLTIGVSGLDENEISAMLSGLRF